MRPNESMLVLYVCGGLVRVRCDFSAVVCIGKLGSLCGRHCCGGVLQGFFLNSRSATNKLYPSFLRNTRRLEYYYKCK